MTLRRAVLVAVAVASFAVAATSAIRTVRSFYQLDFGVTWIAEGIRLDQVLQGSSADQAGLAAGDLIVAVDGVGLERLENPLFGLASGAEHELTVRRGGETLTGVVYRPPPARVDSPYLARSAVAAFGLCCALVALFRTDRREAATFLMLAVCALLVGVIPIRVAAGLGPMAIIHRSAAAAIPFLAIRFFMIFPERRQQVVAVDLVTVAAMVFAGCTAVVSELRPWWPQTLSILRVLFTTGLLFGIVLQCRRWWMAAGEARIRRQIEWMGVGLFVGLVPLVSLVLIPEWLGLGFEPFEWLAILPIVFVPVGFVAALTEYRLWDLEPITRDLVSATLVISFGGFIFALTNHFLLAYMQGLGPLRNLLAFATGVLLVVLLQPVRTRVERFIDQWLHHGRPTPRWMLTHTTRELATVTDPQALLARLSETLTAGLDFDHVAAYLRVSESGFRRVSPVESTLPPALGSDLLDGPFPQPAESALFDGGIVLRVPLERGGITHGLLYLGLRRGHLPLGSEGSEVVDAFAAQAALGLESARRLEDLRSQAEEFRILHANTQRIIESSSAGILVCDAGGCILSANSRAAGAFDCRPADLVGNNLAEYVELPEGWQPHLPIHAQNIEAVTSGPETRRLVLGVSVLELDTGSFNGRVVVLQDVTEVRELQDRMQETERMAALGRLTAGLTHEINTPLTGISSYAQMLGDITDGDDPRADLIAKLVDQSFRVSRIMANLRQIVRGSRDGPTAVDLTPVVRTAATDAARSIDAEDRLQFRADDGRVMAWCSEGAVELAVANLVRNAFEASPADAMVQVSVGRQNDWTEIVVQDQGSGIPKEYLDKVFEAFFTTKTDRGGTGLGLAITRDMITQLGGEVRLEAAGAVGSRAIIRLASCSSPPTSS
jgi:two-component system NtrC family sensor kinase